jgi:hypothetical protein
MYLIEIMQGFVALVRIMIRWISINGGDTQSLSDEYLCLVEIYISIIRLGTLPRTPPACAVKPDLRLGQAPITESLFLASMRKTKRVFFPVAIGIAQ